MLNLEFHPLYFALLPKKQMARRGMRITFRHLKDCYREVAVLL